MKPNRRPVNWKKAVSSFLAVWMIALTIGGTAALAEGEQEQKDTASQAAAAPAANLGLNVKAAILIEASTGQVLTEVNADQPLPPASMTKMMVEYIVLDMINNNKLTWDTEVSTSKEAASTPPDGSQIYLAEGDKHSVKDLYIAMAVGSANDATIALASYIGGSEQGFVDIMNETAKDLGLETAHFSGATGLNEDTVISARDMAKLAQIILQKYPEFLDYSSIPRYKFRERDTNEMVNWNWMLGSNASVTNFRKYAYEGVDGMKTGYISAAGYCFTGTAKRGDTRLISVVMNTPSKEARFFETAKLFDYGFNHFEKKTVVAPKSVVESVETVKIKKGKDTEVAAVTESDITLMVSKGSEPKVELVKSDILPESELIAPIAAGQKVGTLTYEITDSNGQKIEKNVNLVASEEVEKASWWRLFFRAIKDFFVGLFNGIMGLF
ncbi:D-alanyl-D-alanine carboxypeptidase family protein [Paenibacillus tarimensis]|uniref:D-alanyl-D-alanine carboxypeptidase family protein n=1 Tax=Paenibacillus tarimensis TaxID=416012 RepID=UPI001F2BD82E|nr:D-alanyl-D-alanine carboxypeptidase family protein [Paenibacillus tarimensis]